MVVRPSEIGFGTLAQRPDARNVPEGARYVAIDTGLTYRAARIRWDVLPVAGVAKVALGHADTAGGILAFQNSAGVDIIVTNVLLLLTASGGDLVDYLDTAEVGVAANGTTTSATIAVSVALDWDTVPKVVLPPNLTPALCPAGQYVTVSTSGGSAAPIAGWAYIAFMFA